ncbi:MAG: hypothetical protein H6835_19695 [Planctomycetes bacterium]|nr:hypothetical protein [Planctomycetota bacterium]
MSNPQLAYALLQAQIIMGIVSPVDMQTMVNPVDYASHVIAAVVQQQQQLPTWQQQRLPGVARWRRVTPSSRRGAPAAHLKCRPPPPPPLAYGTRRCRPFIDRLNLTVGRSAQLPPDSRQQVIDLRRQLNLPLWAHISITQLPRVAHALHLHAYY